LGAILILLSTEHLPKVMFTSPVLRNYVHTISPKNIPEDQAQYVCINTFLFTSYFSWYHIHFWKGFHSIPTIVYQKWLSIVMA